MPSDISAITFPAANPTQSELIAALTKAPINTEGQAALTLNIYNTLPLKDRQLIAILINRGLLSWERNSLVDFHNDPVTLAMVEDYIHRLDLFLAAAQVKETTASNNKKDANTNTKSESNNSSTSTSTSTSKKSILTLNNLVIVVGLATAIATIIWGYREWTSNTAAIKTAEKQAKLEADVKNLKVEVHAMKVPPPSHSPTGGP